MITNSAEIRFHKLTAAGNDFLCIDNTDGKYDALLDSEDLPRIVRSVCHRALGAGGDGIIFAGEDTGEDFAAAAGQSAKQLKQRLNQYRGDGK